MAIKTFDLLMKRNNICFSIFSACYHFKNVYYENTNAFNIIATFNLNSSLYIHSLYTTWVAHNFFAYESVLNVLGQGGSPGELSEEIVT